MRVDLPFESATRVVRTGRIKLAVDTSGSIDESLLRRFAAEVAAVLGELSASCLDFYRKHVSGKDAALLPHPPIRTARESFDSSRSSLSDALLGTRFRHSQTKGSAMLST